MIRYVFDSFAIIALFKEESGYELVKDCLIKITNNEASGYISAINVGEIFYMMCRKSNIKIANEAIQDLMKMPLEIMEPDLDMCLKAAAIKAKNKLSYSDCFAAVLSIEKSAILITGDLEFNNLIGNPGFKVHFM
ncbi:MAG: PIN domain-containing protein [Saprospiraceae bacterium]